MVSLNPFITEETIIHEATPTQTPKMDIRAMVRATDPERLDSKYRTKKDQDM